MIVILIISMMRRRMMIISKQVIYMVCNPDTFGGVGLCSFHHNPPVSVTCSLGFKAADSFSDRC